MNSNKLWITAMMWLVALPALASEATLTTLTQAELCAEIQPFDSEALQLVGAWKLTSDMDGFGGFSGLDITQNGTALTMVSDKGTLWHGALAWQGESLTNITGLRVIPLSNGALSKAATDSESIRAVGDNEWVISFEHDHRLERIDAAGQRTRIDLPTAITATLPGNGGIEAFVPHKDGYLLFSEDAKTDDNTLAAWWWHEGAAPILLQYRQHGGFSPTDAVALSDNTLLVLEREYIFWRFGLRSRLVKITLPTLRKNATLVAEPLATMGSMLDNTEGLSLFTRDNTRYIATISDDNFLPIQDTVLSLWRLK